MDTSNGGFFRFSGCLTGSPFSGFTLRGKLNGPRVCGVDGSVGTGEEEGDAGAVESPADFSSALVEARGINCVEKLQLCNNNENKNSIVIRWLAFIFQFLNPLQINSIIDKMPNSA